MSPTEPRELRAIGKVSSNVEKRGCDVVVVGPSGKVGIQRKTWTDLIISLGDGRLANSIPLMSYRTNQLVLEGKEPTFDRVTGKLKIHSRGRNSHRDRHGNRFVLLRYTRESLQALLISLRLTHGIDVVTTTDLAGTIRYVMALDKYLAKTEHKGLAGSRKRKVIRKDSWGVVTKADRFHARRLNFLMACGLGLKTSENLLKLTKDKIPAQWLWDRDEFMSVPLIGHATADRLLGLFE